MRIFKTHELFEICKNIFATVTFIPKVKNIKKLTVNLCCQLF